MAWEKVSRTESFDVILCTEVFEHLKNPVLALKEFNRILKHSGSLSLQRLFAALRIWLHFIIRMALVNCGIRIILRILDLELKKFSHMGTISLI